MPKVLVKEVPITPLLYAEMDQIALGTEIRNNLSAYDEMEQWEDRLKEFIADKILIADKYWKYVLQRILDIVEKIDGVQDAQIDRVLTNAHKVIYISRIENQILEPGVKENRDQMQLWVA